MTTDRPPSDDAPELQPEGHESPPAAGFCGGDSLRKHPVASVVGAFLAGAVIGALIAGRGQRPSRAGQRMQDWLGAACSCMTQKLPGARRYLHACHNDSLMQQAREAGRKLRFW